MIVSFSVANFRSFNSEETFSLVASNRLSDSHADHAIKIPDSKEKVLRTGVLYGANGAGKSNLFKALRYCKDVALKSREKGTGTGRERFRFEKTENIASTFDLQFVVDSKLYRFGFKLDDERITEEWLVRVTGSKERILYERITNESGDVTVEIDEGLKADATKVAALATVGGPQNQSFLATVGVMLEQAHYGDDFSSILAWFINLVLVGPSDNVRNLGSRLSNDPDLLSFAGQFLKLASTGVDELKVQKRDLSERELNSMLPENLRNSISQGVSPRIIKLGEGNEVHPGRQGGDPFQITVQALHQHKADEVVALDLNEESDGTCRLLNLIPALYDLQKHGAVYFIDEIDRSLHPNLVWNFLEAFLKSAAGSQGQIIVTTHESTLLDQKLLRRDEIWFAEKDSSAATHLYSLIDFQVRKDLEIRKHYLQGRFGAIPFFGNLDGLLNEIPQE